MPTYTFSAPLWDTGSEPTWVFVTVPAGPSDEIDDLVPDRPGFGSVRVEARIGETGWKTSVFPSKQAAAYVLPVKRSVRDAERIDAGDTATITISVLLDDLG